MHSLYVLVPGRQILLVHSFVIFLMVFMSALQLALAQKYSKTLGKIITCPTHWPTHAQDFALPAHLGVAEIQLNIILLIVIKRISVDLIQYIPLKIPDGLTS